MIILDTTVLGYAVGGDHPLRDPCRRLLVAQQAGAIDGATTVEVIQEFTHIQARRRQRDDAVALAQAYAASLRLLVTTPDDLELGLRLFAMHPRLGAFDAMLAAVTLNQGADALISADGGFGTVTGLRWIDPGTPDLATLLG